MSLILAKNVNTKNLYYDFAAFFAADFCCSLSNIELTSWRCKRYHTEKFQSHFMYCFTVSLNHFCVWWWCATGNIVLISRNLSKDKLQVSSFFLSWSHPEVLLVEVLFFSVFWFSLISFSSWELTICFCGENILELSSLMTRRKLLVSLT